MTSPGAATVEVAPSDRGLGHAAGTEWTQRGPVTADWTRDDDHVVPTVTVPDNVVATASLPDPDGAAYEAPGAGAPTFVGDRDGRALFTVGSGRSRFAVARGGSG